MPVGRTLRTRQRLVSAPLVASVVLTSLALPGVAAASSRPADPVLAGEGWDVPHGSVNDAGALVLNDGHVDVASVVEDDRLTTRLKDTSRGSEPQWLPTDEAVLQVLPSAEQEVPDGTALDFLGAPGTPFWGLPETQQDGLLWPGWSTESIPGGGTPGGVAWMLTGVDGPGDLVLFASDPQQIGAHRVLLSSRDGGPDTFTIPERTHAHGSWAFSAEGAYCLGFRRSAQLASGEQSTHDFTLTVAVGRTDVGGLDPAACARTDHGRPADDDTTPPAPADLTEESRGGVVVRDGSASPGGRLTAEVGADRAGTWVSVWLGGTQWLGWVRVGADGSVGVTLPDATSPGRHVLVVEDRADVLVGWTDLQVVQAPGGGPGPDPGPTPPPAPGAVWDLPNGTVNAAGATVLNDGHVDVASLLEGDALRTRIKDTTAPGDAVWRDPARTVLQVLPGARTSVPDVPAYGFLGAPGAPLWQLSHQQQTGLLWPGWSTEAIPLAATRTGVTWALTDASGPGDVVVHRPTAQLGGVEVLFSTRDGITAADRVLIPRNTHAHGAWAFTAEGRYCLAFEWATELADGRVVRDASVLAVAVGTADVQTFDPASCAAEVAPGSGSTPVLAEPADGPLGAGAAPAARAVAATRCTAAATVLSAGHVDWASRVVGGRLRQLVGDDATGTKIYREPSGVVLWLKPSSRVTLPAGFGAVGAAGTPVWQVPQSQDPSLVWLGWNTELLNAGNAGSPVTWTLDSVDGPGDVTVFLSGAFGGVQSVVFDGTGRYEIPLGVHAHANWAFSAQGVYRLRMTQSVTLAGGARSSDTATLTIAVGDVDPATAVRGAGDCAGAAVAGGVVPVSAEEQPLRAATQVSPLAAAAVVDLRPGRDAPALRGGAVAAAAAVGEDDPVPLLLAVLGGLLLVGGGGTGLLWWRGRGDASAAPGSGA